MYFPSATYYCRYRYLYNLYTETRNLLIVKFVVSVIVIVCTYLSDS